MPWDETDVREGFTYQARKAGKWVTIKAFGGLLTENVAQGLARDLLVNAMFKCEAEKMPVVLTVHDEIVSQVEENRADPAVLKQIMLDRPGWACNIAIPVDAECWAGSRYKK
jgi:DNA polymerase